MFSRMKYVYSDRRKRSIKTAYCPSGENDDTQNWTPETRCQTRADSAERGHTPACRAPDVQGEVHQRPALMNCYIYFILFLKDSGAELESPGSASFAGRGTAARVNAGRGRPPGAWALEGPQELELQPCIQSHRPLASHLPAPP